MDTTTVLEIIKMIDSEINALDMMIAKEQWINNTPNTKIISLDGQLKTLLVLRNSIECKLADYNEAMFNALEKQTRE